MKYQLLELGIYKRYVCVCSISDPKEFYETFDVEDPEAIKLFEDAWYSSKAFMFTSWIVATNNAYPKLDYEHRCYYIIYNNKDKNTKYITHGLLAHEIQHVLQDISETLDHNLGKEGEAYLVETITDFVYKFFKHNKIKIYDSDRIKVTELDKHKQFIKYPTMY